MARVTGVIFRLGRQYILTSATGVKTEHGCTSKGSLREWTRIDGQRHSSPSEAIIDSQTVKSAAMVNQSVGFDANKKIKGRKRFITVDTLGLILRVFVTAANRA